MRRVINEATADNVNRHGGGKIGDFGMGGRTYERYYRVDGRRGDAGSGGAGSRKRLAPGQQLCCFSVTLALATVLLFYFELKHGEKMGALAEAAGAHSYGFGARADPALAGKLVHARTAAEAPPVLLNERGLEDSFFAFQAPVKNRDVELQRVTEYCQWMEMEHHRQIVVGKDPDYCTESRGQSGGDCDRVSCSSRNCPSDCCTWVEGATLYKDETWYTYHKGWRPHRVNSLLFDSPAAYHNPQRDPAPSMTYSSRSLVDMSGGRVAEREALLLEPSSIAKTFTPLRQEFIYKHHADNIGEMALRGGFTEVSHTHFYSRKPTNGWDSPGLLQAAAAYLVDGVLDANSISKGLGVEGLLARAGLDWLTKGTCEAGDVRVSFATRSLPPQLSALGEQRTDNVVGPHLYKSGLAELMVFAQSLDVEGMLTAFKSESGSAIFWRRLAVGAVTTLSGFVAPDVFTDDSNTFASVFAAAALFATAELAALTYVDGAQDKMLLAAAVTVPALLFAIFQFAFRRGYSPGRHVAKKLE